MLNERLKEKYNSYFERYDVPERIKHMAICMMARFTIGGVCDGMYISNRIAVGANIGDGNSKFNSDQIADCVAAADYFMSAYRCNIFDEDKDDVIEILATASLDNEKAIAGIKKFIERCEEEKQTCEEWRINYLNRLICEANDNIQLISA